MKLAKRAMVLLLTLVMLLGCVPAFSVAAEDAVIEGVSTENGVITSYEQIYVKNGLVLLSTVYGNEGDGNITLSTDQAENGVWNNRVGDDNIAIVGRSKVATGTYNGWWIGANGKGLGYNLYDHADWNAKKRLYGMRLPVSLLGEKDIAVEYVFDYIGMEVPYAAKSDKDSGHGAFTFQGMFITFYQPSSAAADSYGKTGMDMVFHYANVGLEYNPGKASPINGGVSGTVTSKLLSAEDDPETDINESLLYAKEGALTMTINRDYASGGPNMIGGKNYEYAGYNVYLNGVSKVFLDNHLRHNDESNYSAEKNADLLDAKYYTAADIQSKGQQTTVKYTGFDAFFGIPAQVYAVRVYDRQISEAEQAQNHFADIVGWFGNGAIDLGTYSALSNMAKANVHAELADVSFTLTTADAVNAVIAKWAAEEIVATDYDKLYVQDGLVLLTTAFGNDASLDLANGVWYNKAENGVTNVKINGTWNALANGGIGSTATTSAGSGKGNYLSFNGVVSTLGDFTVEYFASLKVMHKYAELVTQKFGDWGDFFYQQNDVRQLYNQTNSWTNYMHGFGVLSGKTYEVNTATATTAHVIDNESKETNSYRTQYINAVIPNPDKNTQNHLDIDGRMGTKGDTVRKNYQENPNFWIARNLTSEVYAIRVYNRALTAAEVKLNAAVDKLAQNGVDVSELAKYDNEYIVKTSLATALNANGFDEMQAIVDAAAIEAARLAGIPVAIGYQKGNDGTSLRIWATINSVTVENATALGMDIVVTGDVTKTLGGETTSVFSSVKSGDKIVCPEKEDTYYFAAMVVNIPTNMNLTFEIRPYAVVNGEKVYGESKTLEWPTVEGQA